MILARWMLTIDFESINVNDMTTLELLHYVPVDVFETSDEAKLHVDLEAKKYQDSIGKTSALEWHQMPEDSCSHEDGDAWYLMRVGDNPVNHEPVAVLLMERLSLRREP